MSTENKFVGSSRLTAFSECVRELAEGVKYIKKIYKNSEGRDVAVFAVTVEPGSPALADVWAEPQGVIKIVPEQVEEMEAAGRRVLAAANADFFHFFSSDSHETYGAQIVDGKVIVEPNDSTKKYGNNWFGRTFDGKYVITDAAEYYSTYKGKLACAVGGGYRLVQNGVVTMPDDYENDPDLASDTLPDPRTCIGISPEGGFALICVDGRSEASAGASYSDEAQLFFDLDMNITEVLNLDGGGSVAIAVESEVGAHEVVNTPCSDPMRPVADIIAIVIPNA